MFWLQMGQERFPLRNGETTLGRSPYCSVVIESPAASREHACINVSDTLVEIRDLESRNGTEVNGKRIHRAKRLRSGDSVTIGSETLEVRETPAYTETRTATLERTIVPPTEKKHRRSTDPIHPTEESIPPPDAPPPITRT